VLKGCVKAWLHHQAQTRHHSAHGETIAIIVRPRGGAAHSSVYHKHLQKIASTRLDLVGAHHAPEGRSVTSACAALSSPLEVLWFC